MSRAYQQQQQMVQIRFLCHRLRRQFLVTWRRKAKRSPKPNPRLASPSMQVTSQASKTSSQSWVSMGDTRSLRTGIIKQAVQKREFRPLTKSLSKHRCQQILWAPRSLLRSSRDLQNRSRWRFSCRTWQIKIGSNSKNWSSWSSFWIRRMLIRVKFPSSRLVSFRRTSRRWLRFLCKRSEKAWGTYSNSSANRTKLLKKFVLVSRSTNCNKLQTKKFPLHIHIHTLEKKWKKLPLWTNFPHWSNL